MKKFIVFTIILLFSSSMYSQDSLMNYLEIAAKNNPGVMQKFSEYKAALQKIPQVGSLPDPELSLGVFLKPMELMNGNQVADIRLMQMFPWFGVLKNARDEMSLMANAKYELFRDAKSQLFYDVQKTWYELYKIRQEVRISEKNTGILKIIERLTVARFKAGSSGNSVTSSSVSGIQSGSAQAGSGSYSGMQPMGTGSGNFSSSGSKPSGSSMPSSSMGSNSGGSGLADFYTIQIETGELENNIALLKNQDQSLTALFNSYLNRPPVAPVFTSEKLEPDSLELSLATVSDSILANNPMLRMLKFEIQSFEAREKMVTGMGYPMVGLGVNYSLINKNPMSTSSMSGQDMIMPMVTVTLPFYRKKYIAMKTEAGLLGTAALQNYQATVNSLQTEYYQAVQFYHDARRRIKLYENQYLLASKSLDLMIKSFSTSSSGLTDVLRVRQQTLDYELKQVEALSDFNTAVAWLKRLGNLELEGNK
jgi:outer membrane protein TolC